MKHPRLFEIPGNTVGQRFHHPVNLIEYQDPKTIKSLVFISIEINIYFSKTLTRNSCYSKVSKIMVTKILSKS